MLNIETLRKARSLAVLTTIESREQAVFENSLGDLGAQLSIARITREAPYRISDRERAVLRSIMRVDSSIADFFTRLSLIEDIWERSRSKNDETFFGYGRLAVKDIHVDIAAILDALAPVAIQATEILPSGEAPGFGDLLESSPRSYRGRVPLEVRTLVDDSLRWIRPVRRIRQIVTHREHEKIVFGRATDRRQFQVYGPNFTPKISDHFLFVERGRHIVDLDRYLAFVWAELSVFMDELGRVVAQHLDLSISGQLSRFSDATYLVTELDGLLSGETAGSGNDIQSLAPPDEP